MRRPEPLLRASLLATLALPGLLLGLLFSNVAQAAPELCRISFSSGAVLRMPVARTWQAQQEGLSGRLGAGLGLLFLWEQSAVRTLWMKNTYIPLSAAFIDANGKVLEITDMESASEDRHNSPAPVNAAIELAQGDFARLGIKAGDQADIHCETPSP